MQTKKKMILAVSGGADSVYLLLNRCGLIHEDEYEVEYVVAHFNHCQGDPEADGDQAFVKNLAAQEGLPFYTSGKAPTEQQLKSFGYEGSWRKLRYAWLRELKTELRADYIVTGHNLDDNVETVAMKILDGVPKERASGMSVISGDIYRPLLTHERDMIRANLWGRPYRESTVNTDYTLRRNYLREFVLAGLKTEDKFRYIEVGRAATQSLADEACDRVDILQQLVVYGRVNVCWYTSNTPAFITAIQQYTDSDSLPRVAAKSIKGLMEMYYSHGSVPSWNLRKDVKAKVLADTLYIEKIQV